MNLLFEITFQSGNFYNQDSSSWLLDLFTQMVGSLIGVGVTLWIFYRTYKKNKKVNEEKRIQLQKEKIKYFKAIIQNILKDLKEQIDYYKEFACTLRDKPFDLTHLKQVPLNDIERIVHKINLEDYYHSYLSKYIFGSKQEIIEEFRSIISSLDYFDGNINEYKKTLPTSYDFFNDKETEFNVIFDKLRGQIHFLGII